MIIEILENWEILAIICFLDLYVFFFVDFVQDLINEIWFIIRLYVLVTWGVWSICNRLCKE